MGTTDSSLCLILPLSRGLIAAISPEDAHLTEFPWSVASRQSVTYAQRNVVRPDGSRTILYLHRAVMGDPPEPGLVVDHRNGRGLDCRRENLRWATHATNMRNRRRSSSGYMGVRQKASGKWMAYGTDGGRQVHLGTYETAEDANVARLKWDRAHHGVQPRRIADYEEAGLDPHSP